MALIGGSTPPPLGFVCTAGVASFGEHDSKVIHRFRAAFTTRWSFCSEAKRTLGKR
jgi:hypothetical protein